MITELTITPEYGDSLTLSVPGPSDGYLVKEIEGLDPVPVTLSSTKMATIEGERFQASRLEKRNIVLKIKLDQNYAQTSISARRNRLYLLGLGKQELTLDFTSTEVGTVTIIGRVEEFDAPSSTDDPTATVSIICHDPLFKASEQSYLEGSVSDDPQILTYSGNTSGPIRMHLLTPVGGSIPGLQFEFTHVDTNRITGLFTADSNFGTNAINGWIFSSTPGDKYFRRETEGSSSMRIVDFSNLIWPVLFPGDTSYIIRSLAPTENTMEYSITWFDLFGGI